MKTKLLEKITRYLAPPTRIAALLFAIFAMGATTSAWADFTKTNPVTDETESYTWKFVGTDTWNNTDCWQNSAGNNPDKVPARTYTEQEGGNSRWEPILFDGNTIDIKASMSVEGWNLRMGLYNGANVRLNTFVKWQGDTTMWVTVDDTSKFTVGGFGKGNIADGQVIKYSTSRENGIEWLVNLESTGTANNTFEYYLKGEGSVSYQAVSAANHKIKMADVTLSGGAKSVQSKTLVSFTSTTKDFTADAMIKLKDDTGVWVGSRPLGTINTTGTTSLTTADPVGACELVKSSTDIKLYWVDGDPSDVNLYSPSINVNFSYNTTKISTCADVGAAEWAVPGVFWNTMTSAQGSTFNTPLSNISKPTVTGLSQEVDGMSVAVSDTRGSWHGNGGDAASDVRHGYIDDNNDGSQAPVVTVSGIPSDFANYRVVLYFSNNDNGTSFGYVEINENAYWGTAKWGSSSSTAFTEGGNYLVSPVIARGDGSLTIKTRCMSSARSGLAAIQIFKVEEEYIASDNGTGALVWNTTPLASGSADGIIDLAGDATLTIDSAASFGKLSLTGFGTLTLDGSAKISATTIDVGKSVVVNMDTARLDATTYTGSGTVVYTGAKPASGKGWTDSANWTGTVWVKDIPTSSNARKDWDPALYGNVNSTLRFTNVNLYFPNSTTTTFPGTVDLDGTGLNICDGYGGSIATFARLTGSGTLATGGGSSTGNGLTINDVSGFTGAMSLTKYMVVIGTSTGTSANGVLQIELGKVATVASGKTWSIPSNVTVGGSLFVNGTLGVGSQSVSSTVTVNGTVTMGSSGFLYAWGGVTVSGTISANSLGRFGDGTTITTTDTGVFEFINSNDTQDHGVNYARIRGTGTLRYADVSGKWRTLSMTNFPTTMVCENNLSSGLILQSSGNTHTIGSLAGSGQMRSDWGGSGSTGDRDLRILQAKDTTYSGVFASSNDRVRDVYVATGAETAGTLTLSGTQTASNGLIVESGAKVKITGTWKGATTVQGSLAFGGTGKVDGDVTTSSGSVLDYTEVTGTSIITGALTLDANTTIRLPAGATFPYKLAGSIVGGSQLAADKYTIGGNAGVVPLKLNSDGSVNLDSVAEFTGNTSWSSLGWNVTPSMGVECTVNVTGSGTLTLNPLIQLTKVTFDVPSDKTLTLTGGCIIASEKICFTGGGTVVCGARNTLAGTITGSATINYPEHVLPIDGEFGAVWTDAEWAGTLVLTNCGREQNENYQNEGDETHGVVRFDQYGSENSTIRAPGYKGISAVTDQNTTCAATLFIDSSDVVEFNHGTGASALNTNGAGFRFAKLAGTGTLRLDGTSDTAQYIFDNVSEFTGNVEITFPETGGRKSFLFGATTGFDVMNSAYAANLVILGDMTVGTGAYESWTWDVPAGIIIAEGKTLTLQNGTKIRALGKDSEGTIKVQTGTSAVPVVATLEGITNSVFNGRIEIGEHATLNIADTSLTTLTIPADSTIPDGESEARTYSNEGTLDLSGCTALTKLHIALGEAKTFDFTKVTLPTTCKDIYYDIGSKRNLTGYSLATIGAGTLAYVTNICYYATETPSEYANGGFTVENVPENADVWLIRQSGALIKTSVSGTSRTYSGGSSFAGAACWHEWDFEFSDLRDTGKCTVEGSGVSQVDMTASGVVTYTGVSTPRESKTAIPSSAYPSATLSFAAPWSAAIRCSMPTVTGNDKAVAIAFGDTTNGMVGLAATANDMVELFNWTPAGGGTYTALAQLKVESPADKDNMHIYVLTVTNDGGNNYVSLYRDAEFIHTAQFTLDSAITQFRVGDVCGARGELTGIPAAADGGYVDYVRLYDKVLPDEDITGLSLRRPFVSAIDLYERTASLFEDWSESGAWTLKPGNNGTPTTAEAPVAAANVTFTADGTTDMSLNLAADVRYGTMIIQGSGAVGLHQTSTGRIGAEMFVVRSGVNLTVDYNAVNLATATTVGVDENAKLIFDFSEYPFGRVTATTTITLIDNAPDPAYNAASRSRYSVVLPDTLPINISTVADSWDGASYKLTITVDHEAGGTVYYKEGALTAGMTVYTDSALTSPTKLFPNDTLVVSNGSITGDLTIDDLFNGNISVTRTTVNLASTGNAALASKTVTVETGCTLNFAGGEFGAMTLVGSGSFAFTQDTTVASLTGTVRIAVNDGVTLTLRNETPFVSGGVTGAGTIKLPVHTSGGLNFKPYFHNDGTIAVTGFSGWIMNGSQDFTTALRLDGDMTLTGLSDWTYKFAKISGTGNLTFPNAASPTLTITDLADYTGTIINNHASANVTVTKLTKTGVYVAGDVLLTKGTGTRTDSVVVSAVEIDGSTKHGFWDGDNYRMAAAEYNGQGYASVDSAITAAGDINLSGITVYEPSETLRPGYSYVVVEGVTKVVKSPFAVVKSGARTYYTDAQTAIIDIGMSGQDYDYIEVLVGGRVEIPLNILASLKIKNTGNAELVFTGIADDCTFAYDTTNPNYTVYSMSNKATVYTWTGEALDSSRWDASGNWSYVNISSQTVTASRQPTEGDTVVFNANATVTVGLNTTVAAITCSAAVTFSNDSAVTLSATTGGIVLTDADASISVTGVTLSPAPTTNVSGMTVKTTESAGTTTYAVVPAIQPGVERECSTEDEAQAVAAAAEVVVPSAVADVLTTSQQGDYKSLFQVQPYESSGTWYVGAVFTAAAQTSIQEEIATAFSSVVSVTEDEVTTYRVTVTAKPGLHYAVETCGSANGTYVVNGEPVMATGNSVTLPFPMPTTEPPVKYYKIKVTP